MSAAPWPPPPDLHSIRELVRAADVEGLIEIHGAPADEYEPEEEAVFNGIAGMTTAELISPNIMLVLESTWLKSFELDEAELELRRPALEGLATQIQRFFGPDAVPQVRG